MPELNPYRSILNEFVEEEFAPLVRAKNKSKAIPFSEMVLNNKEFKDKLPKMSVDEIMAMPEHMRKKALDLDRDGILRKFHGN